MGIIGSALPLPSRVQLTWMSHAVVIWFSSSAPFSEGQLKKSAVADGQADMK